jgi:two-component system, response regulator PdtaR
MSAAQPAKPRLLIVEDEVMIRVFMCDVFENAGFTAREAANADEALELLKAEEFAAVVSDILMPGTMTGLDLARVIDSKWPRTGIVLVSGRGAPSLARMPAKARFIAKPCHVDVLLQTVREVLHK